MMKGSGRERWWKNEYLARPQPPPAPRYATGRNVFLRRNLPARQWSMLHNVFISHICYTPSSRTLSHHSLTFPRVQTVTGVKISIALTTSSSDFLCSLPSQSYLLGSNCEKREKRKNDIEVGGAPEMCDSGGSVPSHTRPPLPASHNVHTTTCSVSWQMPQHLKLTWFSSISALSTWNEEKTRQIQLDHG